MKTILVPTDFSTEANNALDFAMQLALKNGAEIKLLHVIELPSASFRVTGDVQTGVDSLDNVYTLKLLDTIKANLSEQELNVSDKGIKVSSQMEIGNVYKHISQNISEEDTDLIVMGSKGATGWKEVLIGSNAERVIRNSEVPVLTIKEKTDLSAMKNMVYAIGDCSDKSVPVVKNFQKILGLNCHLLKVYNTTKISYTHASAKDYVRNFAKNTEFVDFTVNVIDAPWVEEGILDFVSHNKIDMIAMGTHGYKGLSHFLNGSRAEDVANHAKIPVLTIKQS
ncbi:MAG: universal stress protein [Cyclobacteriaceae bacterium]